MQAPSVFGSSVAVVPPSVGPTRPALHIERDAEYIQVCRSLRATCTRGEWLNTAHRRLAIAKAWEQAVQAIRSDEEEFVAFAPLTLYRDPLTGEIVAADRQLPGDTGPRWIDQTGRPMHVPPATFGLARERTSYARWAEGPLSHIDTEMRQGHTPDDDREIQALRHQNAAMRALMDSVLAPAEWAPLANTHTAEHGLVDFRLRGVFRRKQLRRFESKQTGDVSGLMIAGRLMTAEAFDPTTEDGLDAILEADE